MRDCSGDIRTSTSVGHAEPDFRRWYDWRSFRDGSMEFDDVAWKWLGITHHCHFCDFDECESNRFIHLGIVVPSVQ